MTEYYDYFKERYVQAQAEIEHLMFKVDRFEKVNEAQADQLGQAYDESVKYRNALEKISEDGNSNDFAADPGKWPCNIAKKALKND